VVRLVEVFQEHDRRVVPRDRHEGAPHHLEQGRPIDLPRRLPQLGQQEGQVAAEPIVGRQTVRYHAQERAQRGHERTEGRRRRGAGRHPQDRQAASRQNVAGQARLADSGLASQQHQSTPPGGRPGDDPGELGAELFPPDQSVRGCHGRPVYQSDRRPDRTPASP
jgi:hypothetical protein